MCRQEDGKPQAGGVGDDGQQHDEPESTRTSGKADNVAAGRLITAVAATVRSAADLKTFYQALALQRRLDRSPILEGFWRVLLGGLVAGGSAIGLYVTLVSATITAANSARDSARIAEEYARAEAGRTRAEKVAADAEKSEADRARAEALREAENAKEAQRKAVADRDVALENAENAREQQRQAIADRDEALTGLREAEDTVRRELRFLGSLWRTGAEFDGPRDESTFGQDLIAKLVSKIGERCGASSGRLPGEPRRLRVSLGAQGHFQYEAMLRDSARGLRTCSGVGVWRGSENELTLQFCDAFAKGTAEECQGPPLLTLRGTVAAAQDLPPVIELTDQSSRQVTPFRLANAGFW